jgi:hypothetical protein
MERIRRDLIQLRGRLKKHVVASQDFDINHYKRKEKLPSDNGYVYKTTSTGFLTLSNDALINLEEAMYLELLAIEKGEGDIIYIELLPIPEDLVPELGHLTTIETLKSWKGGDFGNPVRTYLQSKTFGVLPSFGIEALSPVQHAEPYVRIHLNKKSLLQQKNVYLDPESIDVIEEEFGHGFIIQGKIPISTIERIEVVQPSDEMIELPTEEQWDKAQNLDKDEDFKKEFLEKLISNSPELTQGSKPIICLD